MDKFNNDRELEQYRQRLKHKINKYTHFKNTREYKNIYNIKLNNYVNKLNSLPGGQVFENNTNIKMGELDSSKKAAIKVGDNTSADQVNLTKFYNEFLDGTAPPLLTSTTQLATDNRVIINKMADPTLGAYQELIRTIDEDIVGKVWYEMLIELFNDLLDLINQLITLFDGKLPELEDLRKKLLSLGKYKFTNEDLTNILQVNTEKIKQIISSMPSSVGTRIVKDLTDAATEIGRVASETTRITTGGGYNKYKFINNILQGGATLDNISGLSGIADPNIVTNIKKIFLVDGDNDSSDIRITKTKGGTDKYTVDDLNSLTKEDFEKFSKFLTLLKDPSKLDDQIKATISIRSLKKVVEKRTILEEVAKEAYNSGTLIPVKELMNEKYTITKDTNTSKTGAEALKISFKKADDSIVEKTYKDLIENKDDAPDDLKVVIEKTVGTQTPPAEAPADAAAEGAPAEEAPAAPAEEAPPKPKETIGSLDASTDLSTGVTEEQRRKDIEKLSKKSCIKEFIRIRPFLKIVDERATDLQMQVGGQKYDYRFLRAFQNITRMISNQYCIDFTRVFEPLEVNKSFIIYDADNKPVKNIATLKDVVGGEAGITDIEKKKQNDNWTDDMVKKKIKEINDIFVEKLKQPGLPLVSTDGKKLYNAAVNGGIFNDMAEFIKANKTAYDKDNNIPNDGFIDRDNMKTAGTWEKQITDETQRNFATSINKVTLEPIFADKEEDSKNVLVVFYGASGSGKTFSSNAIITDLFRNIEKEFEKNENHKGFEIKLFSDYLNDIYDYNSVSADLRYKTEDKQSQDINTTIFNQANVTYKKLYGTQSDLSDNIIMLEKLLGTSETDYKIIKGIAEHTEQNKQGNPIEGTKGDKDVEQIFKKIVAIDALTRAKQNAQNIKLSSAATKYVNTNKYTYFCEGLKDMCFNLNELKRKEITRTETKKLGGKEQKVDVTKDVIDNLITTPKLMSIEINNINDVFSKFKELKHKIKFFRGVNDTGLNAESSRSHLVILVTNLNREKKEDGTYPAGRTFCLIDLAGTEDLNYLIPKSVQKEMKNEIPTNTKEQNANFTKMKTNISNFKEVDDWVNIPSDVIFPITEGQISSLKSVTDEIINYYKTVTSEYIRMKKLAKLTEKKYEYIQKEKKTDPEEIERHMEKIFTGEIIDKLIFDDNYPHTGGKNETSDNRTYDYITLAGMLKMMCLESKHINNSLSSFRELLNQVKKQKNKNPDNPVNIEDCNIKTKYGTSDVDNIILVDKLICPLVNTNPNIVIIGAINPRRTDDFNSYKTMTNISNEMKDSCPSTATECK